MISTSNKYRNGKGEHYPVIGNFIHYHIIHNKIKKADVARALGILPTGLNEYFKKESLQFAILWKLSMAMNYNFIAHLGEYLPYRFETIREKALKEELAEKDAIIQKMEIQLEVFRETIRRQ
ncbi:MAG TPA: transcriptional regulator [Flavobacterium sp.]|uniref:Transcriptional regulator n=1 Tax=Flavobacterium taihuense TaxID=2857508 RepID=A0ABS6XQD0_9FLAO|nr:MULTISPECIES: transcriptional regulator [Flavobacterium]MBW4358883.1 transcriptional regulator [Flavobacterium taihuense]HEU4788093.1 transcriptional regulator [Flavobacterium sp.]